MDANVDPYKTALKEASKKRADNEKVLSLLDKSLKKGGPRAAYALSTWYFYGTHVKKDKRKAAKLLRQAANENVPDALYDLAVSYETGVGVKKNLMLAMEYYLRAALYGEKQSVYEVGRCYYYGIGTEEREQTKIGGVHLEKDQKVERVFGLPKSCPKYQEQEGPQAY